MPRVILIVPGIVSGLGLLVFFQAIKTIASIVDETHPVLIAIKSKTDFIVWIFQANQVEEGSERVVQKQVTAVDLNGKKYAFARSSEREVWEILDYLSSEFPNADVGYSDELRKSVSEKIGKKLRRTMGF
ncbi:MAG: hypothetical protein QNK23_11230 [Crocinitomicaceae bacterium]|nr:hypothetical protein [Crocinitomicaceae bacterium]